MRSAVEILIRPVVSEKMTTLGEKLQRYAFVVDKKANKLEIKAAVEEMYGVSVEEVNTMIIPAKARRRNTKAGVINGRKPGYKKAMITLAKGEEIDFYSNI